MPRAQLNNNIRAVAPNVQRRIEIQRIEAQLVHHYNKFNQKRLDEHKKCYDCKEEVKLDFKVYGNRKYCKECYLNVIGVCGVCEKKEKDREEFFPVRIEEDGMKVITICMQCASKLQACEKEHGNCNVYFKKSNDRKCENCDGQYCKLHLIDHQCKIGEPTHLFRRVNNTFNHGNVALAKEIKIPWLVGIELEAVNGDANILHEKLDQRVGMSHDGSLQGRSPIEMQLPPSETDKLEQIIRHTTKMARNAKYRVNKTCGMHIHLDMTKERQNVEYLFRLLSTYYAIEPVIFAMLPMSRRKNKYALPLRNWISEAKMLEMSRKPLPSMETFQASWYKAKPNTNIDRFKNDHYDSSRYHGFNLHAFFVNGTVEMRYHHGTLSRQKIVNWINLHLMVFDWVRSKYDQNVVDAIFFCENPQDKFRLMCRHFKFPKTIRRYIMRNMRKFKDVDIEDQD